MGKIVNLQRFSVVEFDLFIDQKKPNIWNRGDRGAVSLVVGGCKRQDGNFAILFDGLLVRRVFHHLSPVTPH